MEPFTQIKNNLIRAKKSVLNVYEKAVLNVLISYNSCERIYLGQQRLADESGMSRDKVVDVVKSLKEKRYISTEIQVDRSTLGYKLLSRGVVAVSDRPVATDDRGCGCERQGVVATDDTSNKSISNKRIDIKEKKEKIELPDWLDKKAWSEWVQYKKERKKRLTPSTISKQLKLLEKHNGDHVAIIEQSIQNGWQGLFPLKDKPVEEAPYPYDNKL